MSDVGADGLSVGTLNRDRIDLAAGCRDADSIPKIDGAGEVFGDAEEFQRMHNGVIIRAGAYHGSGMTEIIRRLKGHHEPQEEKVFAAALDKMPDVATMVELGSFWAYYSMWFHQKVARPHCILVEPNAEKLAVGQTHFQMNEMAGTFLQGFVGRKSSAAAMFEDWDGTRYRLPMFSVDGLMQEFALPRIDILHADVQGAETEMLMGAERALREGRIGYLFISTHGCEHERCLRSLAKYDYRIIASHSVLESFSGDGLIVARAPGSAATDDVVISKRRPGFGELLKYRLACIKRRILSQLFSNW